jgi:hypothetical protein
LFCVSHACTSEDLMLHSSMPIVPAPNLVRQDRSY